MLDHSALAKRFALLLNTPRNRSYSSLRAWLLNDFNLYKHINMLRCDAGRAQLHRAKANVYVNPIASIRCVRAHDHRDVWFGHLFARKWGFNTYHTHTRCSGRAQYLTCVIKCAVACRACNSTSCIYPKRRPHIIILYNRTNKQWLRGKRAFNLRRRWLLWPSVMRLRAARIHSRDTNIYK